METLIDPLAAVMQRVGLEDSITAFMKAFPEADVAVTYSDPDSVARSEVGVVVSAEQFKHEEGGIEDQEAH
jgi:hypothetical protein